ncbi:MAG: DUF2891 domain-containing protein [Gammaproteobacteria bacterium]|nr:DUF2891 domain-containing protein [Gammaproteobacteria bacterium]
MNQMRELAQIVEVCVKRRDTAHPVFNGCIDWHSSVHGYWSLVFISKMDHKTPKDIFALLSQGNLQKELEFLKNGDRLSRHFEMPYGRAWFLQLARDSEVFFGNKEMHNAATYVYQTLIDYAINSGGSFTSTEYYNASWYCYQLYKWAEHTHNEHDMELIKKICVSRLEKVRSWPEFATNTGFFAPKALALLLLAEIDKENLLVETLEMEIIRDGLKPKTIPFSTAHEGGLNYSRSWGLWALYRLTNNERYKKSWLEHMEYMSQNMNSWKHEYRKYGHWLGQFGLFSYRIALVP